MYGTKFNTEMYLDHSELEERFKKTLHYGRLPDLERPSLPLTEIAVEFFGDACERRLGKVDMHFASSVTRDSCVSPCALMLGMIYIERLRSRSPQYLKQVSSSDLFLVSLMVASKYLYDEGEDEEVFNDEWAAAAQLDLAELNDLEFQFLTALDWRIFVKNSEFWYLLDAVEKRVAMLESRRRGFHTYTDLLVLGQPPGFATNLMWSLTKLTLVCSVAYITTAVCVLGSVALISTIQQQASLTLSQIRLSTIWRPLPEPSGQADFETPGWSQSLVPTPESHNFWSQSVQPTGNMSGHIAHNFDGSSFEQPLPIENLTAVKTSHLPINDNISPAVGTGLPMSFMWLNNGLTSLWLFANALLAMDLTAIPKESCETYTTRFPICKGDFHTWWAGIQICRQAVKSLEQIRVFRPIEDVPLNFGTRPIVHS